jgi:hypothetical protein
MSYSSQIENDTFIFEKLCNQINKVAFIVKLPGGQWAVKSEKGKILGRYKTKQEAVKRLRSIEFWKHKKKASDNNSYSAIMRKMKKENDDEAMCKFQEEFKKSFDAAYEANSDSPEQEALEKAIESVASKEQTMVKQAAEALNLGDPLFAGQRLAQLVSFLLSRAKPEKRKHTIDLMKRKLYYLNEYDIGAKKVKGGQMYGQAITLIKNLLMGHNPSYIRNVINTIVGYLQ